MKKTGHSNYSSKSMEMTDRRVWCELIKAIHIRLSFNDLFLFYAACLPSFFGFILLACNTHSTQLWHHQIDTTLAHSYAVDSSCQHHHIGNRMKFRFCKFIPQQSTRKRQKTNTFAFYFVFFLLLEFFSCCCFADQHYHDCMVHLIFPLVFPLFYRLLCFSSFLCFCVTRKMKSEVEFSLFY